MAREVFDDLASIYSECVVGDNIGFMVSRRRFMMAENCKENGHTFKPISGTYYKLTGERNYIGPTYDHSVGYRKLFCSKCGETKEVVATNHKEVPDAD